MEVILELIKEKAKNKNLVIITGVGKIYPIVRSHALLNNLQNLFNETKVILFWRDTTTYLKLFLDLRIITIIEHLNYKN